MPITPEGDLLLVSTTLRELGKGKWTDIAMRFTDYPFFREFMKRHKLEIGSGYGVQRNVRVQNTTTARHAQMYETDNLNVGGDMKQITVPWRTTTNNMTFDRVEVKMNRQPAQLVSLVEVKRDDMYGALCETIEDTGWSKPADSTDETTPWGLRMFLVSSTAGTSATASTGGFNGGNPAGFTSGYGGLSSTTYPRHANYAHQYVNVSKSDLIRKMKRGKRNTKFMSPIGHKNDYSTGKDNVFYCNLTTMEGFETAGEAQNENLGKDLAWGADELELWNHPIRYVPKLDEDTTNPVMQLNWGVIQVICLEGEYFNESEIEKLSNAHKVGAVHVDTTWGTICTERRRLAIYTL